MSKPAILKLWPIQEQIFSDLRNTMRYHRRVVLMSPTGSGKTEISIKVIQNALGKNKRVCFVCHRLALVYQTAARLKHYGVSYGVVQGDHPDSFPDRPVQVCSIQTFVRRKQNDFDIYIIDECFHRDTMISTPDGDKKISLVNPGDNVYNACGVGIVERVHKSVKKIIKVRLSNGKEIKCTEDHTFFTPRGWTKAKDLDVRERLFSKEDVSNMWAGFSSKDFDGREREGESRRERGSMGENSILLSILREEREESNEKPGVSEESNGYSKEKWEFLSSNSRLERLRGRSSTKNARCVGRKMGFRVYSKIRTKRVRRVQITNSFQNRYSKQERNDCYRDRRIKSLFHKKARAGCKKNTGAGVIRVESIEVDECGIKDTVYNLKVSRHPSYFAEGVLVHNCHVQFKGHIDILNAHPDAYFIAMSATPYAKGLGKYYTALCHPVTMKTLISDGVLKSFEIYGPHTIDLSNVKTVAGDFRKDDLADAADKPKLVADIVATWLKHARDRKTMVFSSGVAHGRSLEKEFRRHGIKAVEVNGYSPKENTADQEGTNQIIDDFKNGKYQVIISAEMLVAGFDVPEVSCVVIATATKSKMKLCQALGRGIRHFEGIDECIVLDHGASIERLGWPDDIEEDFEELDDGKKQESKNKKQEKKEQLPKACPSCNFLKPAGVHKCPKCGFLPQHIEPVEVQAGELKKLQRKAKKDFTVADKQAFLAQLNKYAAEKGYKMGKGGVFGWALYKYKEKFGVNPSSKIKWNDRATPGAEVLGWIKHQNIKKAKSKNKQEIGMVTCLNCGCAQTRVRFNGTIECGACGRAMP